MLVDPSQTQLLTPESAAIPVVLVDPMSRPASEEPSPGVTNWDGGPSAAQHLRELGHADVDVGVIGGSRNYLYGRARIDGFCSEFDDAGSDSVRIGYADWDRAVVRGGPPHAGRSRPASDRDLRLFRRHHARGL